jgi:hypothetical protein
MRQLKYALVTIVLLFAACAKGSPGGLSPDGDGDDVIDDPDAKVPIDADQTVPPDSEVIVPPDAEEEPPPDAGCTVQQTEQQLLLNPAFDSEPRGVNWTQLPQDANYPPLQTSAFVEERTGGAVSAHSQPYLVWLGGWSVVHNDRLYAQVDVPADTVGLRIDGYKFFATADDPGFDHAYIEIMNTADVRLELVVDYPNGADDGAWVPISLTTANPYAGQTIRFQLRSATDSSLNSNFWFDGITLTATVEACL